MGTAEGQTRRIRYRKSTHKTRSMTPASMVFWRERERELCLPCNLLFGARPDKEQSATDCVADLVDRLIDIHHHAREHLKVASDIMKAPCDRWLIPWDSRKRAKSGCTVRPG
jgi:hypothetical protein